MERRFALLAALAAGVAFLCLYSGARAAVVGSPHDFSASGPFDTPATRTNVAPGGSCSACHIPHGAQDNVLWPRDLSSYRTNLENDGVPSAVPNYTLTPTIQCYDCHDYHGGAGGRINDDPSLSDFDTSHKPHNIAFGFTKNGTGSMDEDAPVGSVSGFYENKPPHTSNYGADPSLRPTNPPYPTDNTNLLKTGGHYFKWKDPTNSSNDTFDIGDKLPCRDCHDPHAWSDTPDWQAFIRKNWPSGSDVSTRLSSWSGKASTRMANAPVSGVGSRSDPDSRDICIACHGNSNNVLPVDFTDISSQYSVAAGTIVRPPASVTEHDSSSQVACTACHSHNSIDAGCNDCHSFPGLDNTNSGHQMSSTHWKHVGQPSPEGTANSREFNCEVCHFGYQPNHNQSGYNAGQAWGSRSAYFDNVDRSFDPAWNPAPAAYSGNSSAMGECTDFYCHGNSAAQSDWSGTTSASPPQWDNTTSAPCGSCHGTGDELANANHPAHLDNTSNPFGPGIDNASCGAGGACHTAYGLSPTTTHVDNSINFPTSASDSAPVLFAATGICENCHSTAVVAFIDNGAANAFSGDNLARTNWNDNNYKLPCLTCHNDAGPRANTAIDNSGGTAPNIEKYWRASGHGYPTDDPIDNSSTTRLSSTINQNLPLDCRFCHDIDSRHFGNDTSTGNAWRLVTAADHTAGGGLDKFCNIQCHGGAQAGDPSTEWTCTIPDLPMDHFWIEDLCPRDPNKESADTHPTFSDVDVLPKTAPPAADSRMPLDNDIRSGGATNFLCVTCHDPHGTGGDAADTWGRSFAGSNPTTPVDNVHMLRYEYTSTLCRKCHL
jgi:predicted CxxxxCH...CXXCH cytochrome family protein